MAENDNVTSEAIEVMREAWCDSFNACSLGKFNFDQFKEAFQLHGLKVKKFFPTINVHSDFRYYFCELELSDGFFISQFLLNGLPKRHIRVTEPKCFPNGETMFTALFEFNGKFASLNVSISNMNLN